MVLPENETHIFQAISSSIMEGDDPRTMLALSDEWLQLPNASQREVLERLALVVAGGVGSEEVEQRALGYIRQFGIETIHDDLRLQAFLYMVECAGDASFAYDETKELAEAYAYDIVFDGINGLPRFTESRYTSLVVDVLACYEEYGLPNPSLSRHILSVFETIDDVVVAGQAGEALRAIQLGD